MFFFFPRGVSGVTWLCVLILLYFKWYLNDWIIHLSCMSLVKDAEKPNLPAAFCHFFCGCVTENSSGNRRSLFPSTCFWRVVFLCSPKVKQDLPGSWRMGFAVLFSLAYLDLSFSCCSWHFPLSKGGGVRAAWRRCKSSAFVHGKTSPQ